MGLGGLPDYPAQPNSEYHGDYPGSEKGGDKLALRKGNSPDRQLRSLNRGSV